MGIIINPYTFTIPPFFQDDYTTNTGWTQVGTTVTVDSGIPDKLAMVLGSGASSDRVSKSLGGTLSDSLWYADFDFQATTLTAVGDDAQSPTFCLCSNTGNPRTGTQDNILAFIYRVGAGTIFYGIVARDGTSSTDGAGVTISISTQYYIRIERTTTTNVRISVFSDSARTTHVTGSPANTTIPSSIITLTTLIHGGGNAGSSIISFNIDNTKIYNNMTP